ncbi:MFS quinate transporter-like protein QutD [Atractiella rhizophila]|nr:MFS quinate transporter-like protein QutD [Atractiella rhizophila]
MPLNPSEQLQNLTVWPKLGPKAIWEDVKRYRNAYFMAAAASCTGLIGGVLVEKSFRLSFGLNDKSRSELASLNGDIVSVLQAGCFFGALSSFFLSSQMGRRPSLFVSIWIFFAGSIIQTCSGLRGSKSLTPLYIGRAVGGFGVGLTSAVVPIYIAECAPTEIRGRLTGMMQLFWLTAPEGIMLAYWVNYGLQKNASDELSPTIWRTAFGLQMIPGALMALLLVFQPESPRFLAENGKWDEARVVLIKLKGGRVSEAEKELDSIRADVQGREKLSWKDQGKRVFRQKGMLYRAGIGIIVMFFQQWTGTNSINVYRSAILLSLFFAGPNQVFCPFGSIVKVVCTALGLALAVEQAGRKRSLIVGGMGQAISMQNRYYLGAYGKIHPGHERIGASYGAIAFVYVYVVFYSFGWGTIPWMVATEVIPTNLRSFTMSFALMTQWLFNFVIVRITPTLLESIKYGTFLLFGSMCVLMTLWVLIGLPETKGVPLEEMDLLFAGSVIRTSLEDNPGASCCGLKRKERRYIADYGATADGALSRTDTKSVEQNVEEQDRLDSLSIENDVDSDSLRKSVDGQSIRTGKNSM